MLKNDTRGVSLIESTLAIGVAAILITIFGSAYYLATANRLFKEKNLAANLAREQIETLRTADTDLITNRTNADFIEVAYHQGSWSARADGTAPSSPNAMRCTEASNGTCTAIVPYYEHDSATFEADFKVSSDAPNDWEAGLYYQYHDANNYYLVYASSTAITAIKMVDGSETTMNTVVSSFSKGTWYEMRLEFADSSVDVYIDDTLELSATDSNETFSHGKLALYTGNDTVGTFDDLSISDTVAVTWDFDSDTPGVMPADWMRLSIGNLPQGQGRLTISDYESGFDDIKEVTAEVIWQNRNQQQSFSINTLIYL